MWQFLSALYIHLTSLLSSVLSHLVCNSHICHPKLYLLWSSLTGGFPWSSPLCHTMGCTGEETEAQVTSFVKVIWLGTGDLILPTTKVSLFCPSTSAKELPIDTGKKCRPPEVVLQLLYDSVSLYPWYIPQTPEGSALGGTMGHCSHSSCTYNIHSALHN